MHWCTEGTQHRAGAQQAFRTWQLAVEAAVLCKIDLLHSLKAAAKATISWAKVKRRARKSHCLSLKNNPSNSQNKKLADPLQRTHKYMQKRSLRRHFPWNPSPSLQDTERTRGRRQRLHMCKSALSIPQRNRRHSNEVSICRTEDSSQLKKRKSLKRLNLQTLECSF